MAEKQYPDDDGRTIVDMNVEGFRWYSPNKSKGKGKRKFSAREKRALTRSAFRSIFVPFICLAVGGTLAFLLLYFLWL